MFYANTMPMGVKHGILFHQFFVYFGTVHTLKDWKNICLDEQLVFHSKTKSYEIFFNIRTPLHLNICNHSRKDPNILPTSREPMAALNLLNIIRDGNQFGAHLDKGKLRFHITEYPKRQWTSYFSDFFAQRLNVQGIVHFRQHRF